MPSDAPCRSVRSRLAVIVALSLAIASTACAQTPSARASHASETSEMSAQATRIDADGVALDVEFDARPGAPVEVRYRLQNTGATPLAVFDRGDRHGVQP